MLNKKINLKQKNIVLFVYVIILLLLGPVIVVASNSSSNKKIFLPKVISNKLSFFSPPNSNKIQSLQTRFSTGDRILITADNNFNKQAAVKAFASGDYQTAAELLAVSLKANPNEPETLIYWNNARAALTGNFVKIATSVPIGGNLDVAQEILRGVAQKQQEINQNGGIDGKLVQVEIANDDNDPELAKQIATKFVKDDKILAVIGHNDSDASVAAAPIYQQGGLVMITPTSSANNLSEMGSYIFRATLSTRALADALAGYAVDSARKTNIAICSDSQAEVSKSFQNEFTWAVYDRGGQIIPTKCDFSAPDFNPSEIPSQMVSDGADALLLAPSVRKVDKAIEVARANQGRLTLLGNHSINTYVTLQQGQTQVNGMVMSVPWHPQINSDNSFTVNSRKQWGGAVNWRTAMAYDATTAAIAGLELGFSREGVQTALSNLDFSTEGASEAIKFLPSGDRNSKGTLVRVEPGKKSGTGYDFVSFQP